SRTTLASAPPREREMRARLCDGRSTPAPPHTRDDRVHPGHARKMAALLEEVGHKVWYHENIEGGHGGAADNKQSAFQAALIYEFFTQMLVEKKG
ncbi:prolyl oligopeptidase family serine peptidase, partial [Nocardia cyriacigeorgica]|uniref:prolyl oligopeptidase family serine peptidase n=1 Tax=Nocardia cyriacigeorgica TaxID=135487 RepID=UPI002113CA22